MSVVVRPARSDELPACLAVRHEVFVIGQGVPPELEVDGLDPACFHVIARDGDVPVGAARLRVVDGHAKAERVAVLASRRGEGIGVALMRALEREAARLGLGSIHLHAQWHVVGFYERLGYVGRGEPFDEAGIRHLAMERPLEGSDADHRVRRTLPGV